MTFEQLKESVEDRVKLLEHASTAATVTSAEARLEEARVILDLINRLDAAREEKLDHPIYSVDPTGAVKQVGTITPATEEHPTLVEYDDPDRYDPGRC